jgi:REP element-mobilizing transposase RayT
MPRYHIWFSTKRRKWLLQGEVAGVAERAIRDVARNDGIKLLECKTAIDHVHLVVELPSSEELPPTMKALKGKSARRAFQEIDGLKLNARTEHLWQRGYGWKLVPDGAERTVRQYIRTQMDRLEKYQR